jgi:hypothetical protein
MKRFFVLVLVFGLVVSLAFAAEDTIKLRTLGRSPLTKPVLNAAIAKQVVKNHAEEIRKLENDGLFFALAEQLDQVNFENEIIPIGATMHWMLFGSKKGAVRSIKNVQWAGQESIQGFGFKIIHNKIIYSFFVPKTCGNISLVQIEKQPEKTVAPPPPPQPQEKPKPVESQKPKEQPEPEQPKVIVPPAVMELPQPAPTKKHRPNIKVYAGPWIPWEPMNFSFANQNIDISHNFHEYLPKYESWLVDENKTTSTMYLKEKNFPYQTGDSVILRQQRSMTTRWSGINFIAGLEIRFRENFWLDMAYYQSRIFHANVPEYTEDMLFKEVKYLGYYAPAQESLISCPPQYHRYLLDLNRITTERQTEYSITSRGIRLLLRYYLNIGKSFSLSPAFGIIDQQFVKKTNDTLISKTLFPFKDEVISQSERWERKTEENNYEVALTGNIAAELKLLSFVSIAVEGSYQKFSEQQLMHESSIIPNLESSFRSKPWRATATLKILF